MAATGQIHMGNTIRKDKPVIASETIEHEGKTLIAFHITRAFEEFIKHGA